MSTRAMFLAALFALLAIPLSSQDVAFAVHQATPIVESEPEETTYQRSGMNRSLMTGEPTITYTIFDGATNLPNDNYTTTASIDFNGVTFDVDDSLIGVEFRLKLDFTGNNMISSNSLEAVLLSGSISISPSPTITNMIYRNCLGNGGFIDTTTYIRLVNLDTNEEIWSSEPEGTSTPCTAVVTPFPPAYLIVNCGPDNNEITILDQPSGISVQDSGWLEGVRTFTYLAESWAIMSEDFPATHQYFDSDPPCGQSVQVQYPESMPLLESDSEIPVGVKYDLTSVWPTDPTARAELRLGFDFRFLSITEQPVESTGDIAYTVRLGSNELIDACFAGEGTLNFTLEIRFTPSLGSNENPVFWSEKEDVAIPCSVGIPAPSATFTEGVCGYTDDRIIVDEVPEILGHNITWDGNIATIHYLAQIPFEVTGGPHTVMVTEAPCETDPVPVPVHTEVCGKDNDVISIGDMPEGATYTSSDAWGNGIYTLSFTPLPGWVLPEDTQTRYEFVDVGDCLVTPVAPESIVKVCGPNNDILTIPDQPEGLTVEDSGWVNNERTITFTANEGYALPDFAPRYLTSIDQNEPCEGDQVETTLVIKL